MRRRFERAILPWLFGALLAATLGGCGQKGPLTLPEPAPAAVPAPADGAPAATDDDREHDDKH